MAEVTLDVNAEFDAVEQDDHVLFIFLCIFHVGSPGGVKKLPHPKEAFPPPSHGYKKVATAHVIKKYCNSQQQLQVWGLAVHQTFSRAQWCPDI